MSYATFEDEEAQLPAAPKRTCWTRRIFSVVLVVTVGLVYAAVLFFLMLKGGDGMPIMSCFY